MWRWHRPAPWRKDLNAGDQGGEASLASLRKLFKQILETFRLMADGEAGPGACRLRFRIVGGLGGVPRCISFVTVSNGVGGTRLLWLIRSN